MRSLGNLQYQLFSLRTPGEERACRVQKSRECIYISVAKIFNQRDL